MKIWELPKNSYLIIALCIILQTVVGLSVATLGGSRGWLWVLVFFAATYLADLLTAIFHFGFDYVWPDKFPVMGPISVEFREHHHGPTLDPSAWVGNLTRGAYMGITLAVAAWLVATPASGSAWQFFCAATVFGMSLWGLFFHQIHAYTHMGKTVSPEEFNATVARIVGLPKAEQKAEFSKLFERVGIPKFVRFMQKSRLFLRPEIHWQHHQAFESDFSSLNGWSDPFTNLIFGPIARYKKAKAKAREDLVVAQNFAFERSLRA